MFPKKRNHNSKIVSSSLTLSSLIFFTFLPSWLHKPHSLWYSENKHSSFLYLLDGVLTLLEYSLIITIIPFFRLWWRNKHVIFPHLAWQARFFLPLEAQLVKQLYYCRFKQVMHGAHKTTVHSGKVVSAACSFPIHYGVVENFTALFTLKSQQSEA